MKRLILSALLTGAALAHAQTSAPASAPAPLPTSPAKKELVQRLMVLQQPGIEAIARGLVEQPAAQMMQAAGRAIQQQVAPALMLGGIVAIVAWLVVGALPGLVSKGRA